MATDPTVSVAERLAAHRRELMACSLCPAMQSRPIAGPPVPSKVLLLGQAPGPHEEEVGRPFGWTAGKTLFRWFEELGAPEERFRERVYISAVCRCFPGKQRSGGDRVPSATEIERCSRWLRAEIETLEPELILPVGRLAISQLIDFGKLVDVVGESFEVELAGRTMDAIPLPHPSGASTWFRTEPGRGLLEEALQKIGSHHVFRRDVLSPSSDGVREGRESQ